MFLKQKSRSIAPGFKTLQLFPMALGIKKSKLVTLAYRVTWSLLTSSPTLPLAY